jgi:hypothetical protein
MRVNATRVTGNTLSRDACSSWLRCRSRDADGLSFNVAWRPERSEVPWHAASAIAAQDVIVRSTRCKRAEVMRQNMHQIAGAGSAPGAPTDFARQGSGAPSAPVQWFYCTISLMPIRQSPSRLSCFLSHSVARFSHAAPQLRRTSAMRLNRWTMGLSGGGYRAMLFYDGVLWSSEHLKVL